MDNKRVDDKILLKDNDLIEIGQRKFIFHSLSPESAPGSAKVVVLTLDSPCVVTIAFDLYQYSRASKHFVFLPLTTRECG